MYNLDLMAGRDRYAQMMREADEYRQARKVSKLAGRRSWIDRIAQFITHSGQPTQNTAVNGHKLAAAKSR